jgi:hypothetical protein
MLLRRNPKMVSRRLTLSLPKAVNDRLEALLARAEALPSSSEYDVGAEVEEALSDSLIRMLTRAERELAKEEALLRREG